MKSTIETIKKNKIIVIVRGIDVDHIVDTAKALYDGGIRLMEVTFNQSSPTAEQDTGNAIKAICEAMGDKVCIGAGTVMTSRQVDTAVDAGAKYIISPNINLDVIKRSIKRSTVSMPGAMTPTEIAAAYEAGAEFVKLFPANILGTSYIKAIRSPISHIPMLAVGGINADNMLEYMEAGISGVGIGSHILNKNLVEAEKFEELTALAKEYTQKIK